VVVRGTTPRSDPGSARSPGVRLIFEKSYAIIVFGGVLGLISILIDQEYEAEISFLGPFILISTFCASLIINVRKSSIIIGVAMTIMQSFLFSVFLIVGLLYLMSGNKNK